MRAGSSLPESNRSDPFTISPAVTVAAATPARNLLAAA